jgi:hypothetical protein
MTLKVIMGPDTVNWAAVNDASELPSRSFLEERIQIDPSDVIVVNCIGNVTRGVDHDSVMHVPLDLFRPKTLRHTRGTLIAPLPDLAEGPPHPPR